MNFWKILKIASIVALVIILGVLYMATGDQPSQQHNSTPLSSSSTDGSAFNGIK